MPILLSAAWTGRNAHPTVGGVEILGRFVARYMKLDCKFCLNLQQLTTEHLSPLRKSLALATFGMMNWSSGDGSDFFGKKSVFFAILGSRAAKNAGPFFVSSCQPVNLFTLLASVLHRGKSEGA